VSPWVTINGNRVFISPNRKISYSDFNTSQTQNSSHDPYREKELVEFARNVAYRFQERTEQTNNEAKIIIKTSAVVLASVDPHFATAYMAFRFAQYCYNFVSKIREDYKVNGNLSEAILNTVTMEIKEKVSLYLKNKLLAKASELIVDELLSIFRKENEKFRFYSPLESIIKQSMTETVYLALDKVI